MICEGMDGLLARSAAGAEVGQTRPGVRGALLFYSCVAMSEFGSSWPADVPAQVHGMDAKPDLFVDEGDIDAARALVEISGAWRNDFLAGR
jgi:hypothetical protein